MCFLIAAANVDAVCGACSVQALVADLNLVVSKRKAGSSEMKTGFGV